MARRQCARDVSLPVRPPTQAITLLLWVAACQSLHTARPSLGLPCPMPRAPCPSVHLNVVASSRPGLEPDTWHGGVAWESSRASAWPSTWSNMASSRRVAAALDGRGRSLRARRPRPRDGLRAARRRFGQAAQQQQTNRRWTQAGGRLHAADELGRHPLDGVGQGGGGGGGGGHAPGMTFTLARARALYRHAPLPCAHAVFACWADAKREGAWCVCMGARVGASARGWWRSQIPAAADRLRHTTPRKQLEDVAPHVRCLALDGRQRRRRVMWCGAHACVHV